MIGDHHGPGQPRVTRGQSRDEIGTHKRQNDEHPQLLLCVPCEGDRGDGGGNWKVRAGGVVEALPLIDDPLGQPRHMVPAVPGRQARNAVHMAEARAAVLHVLVGAGPRRRRRRRRPALGSSFTAWRPRIADVGEAQIWTVAGMGFTDAGTRRCSGAGAVDGGDPLWPGCGRRAGRWNGPRVGSLTLTA